MRFERSALFAKENNFGVYATTLGISRWKDMNQINQSGIYAASKFQGRSTTVHVSMENGYTFDNGSVEVYGLK